MPPPPPPPPTAAGAAAAAAVGDFGAKRHGYEGSLFHTNLLRLDDDPVSAWIEQRQRSFRDFEQSLRDPFTTVSRRPHPGVDNLFLPLAASRPKNAWKSQPQYAMLSSSRGLEPPSGDMSPKARVVYDDAKFQVEFDVPDYRPEELSIKTEGDVLIVLAKHETKTEDGGSFVSKQFEQRFTLPAGVRPENITSALSKGGTLTVTAPRESRPTRAINHESGGPSGGGGGSGSGGGHDGQVFRPHSREEGLPHPRVKYDEDRFQISLDCQQYRPEELDVKVEGSSIIITAKQEIKEAGGTRTRVFEQKFTLPSGVRAEKVTSSINQDGVLTITAPRANSHDSSAIEQRMDRVLSPANWDDNFHRRDSGSILATQHQPHMKHTSLFDRDSSGLFPSMHASDGISKVECDDDNYKILVDVKDFLPEELIIKTVGNTVHFEAKHEEKTADGHSYTSRNISQSFTLPRGVDPELVTSSLSKEGTLTISAPLPPALKLQSNERLVPIKHR